MLGKLLGVERPQRDWVGSEARAELGENALDVGTGTIGLVDEQDRRDSQTLERAHEDERLRLDALDRGDDEHDAVENVEDTLDFRDEVGVARACRSG